MLSTRRHTGEKREGEESWEGNSDVRKRERGRGGKEQWLKMENCMCMCVCVCVCVVRREKKKGLVCGGGVGTK